MTNHVPVPGNPLPIQQKAYDFALWLYPHTARFPRSHRFSVAVRLETLALGLLEALQAARRAETRAARLRDVDAMLRQLRILLRLSVDLKCLPFGSYEHAVLRLDELGRMLGGWLKKTRDSPVGGEGGSA